jgi:hypothetical protein
MTLFANPIHKFLKAHILAQNNPLTQVIISNDGNDGRFFKNEFKMSTICYQAWIEFSFFLKKNNPSRQENNMMHLRHYLRYLKHLDSFASSSSSSKFVKIVIYVTL